MKLLLRLDQLERGLCGFGLLLLGTTLFLDLLAQQFFNYSLDWVSGASWFGFLLAAVFSLGAGTAQGSHVRLRVLDRLGPRRWHGVRSATGYALSAGFFLLLFFLAVYVAAESLKLGARASVQGLLLWPAQSILALAFACNVVRFSIYAADPQQRPVEALGHEEFVRPMRRWWQ